MSHCRHCRHCRRAPPPPHPHRDGDGAPPRAAGASVDARDRQPPARPRATTGRTSSRRRPPPSPAAAPAAPPRAAAAASSPRTRSRCSATPARDVRRARRRRAMKAASKGKSAAATRLGLGDAHMHRPTPPAARWTSLDARWRDDAAAAQGAVPQMRAAAAPPTEAAAARAAARPPQQFSPGISRPRVASPRASPASHLPLPCPQVGLTLFRETVRALAR